MRRIARRAAPTRKTNLSHQTVFTKPGHALMAPPASNKIKRAVHEAAALIDSGHLAEARPGIVALIRKQPKLPIVWNLLGALAYREKNFDEAITAFSKAVALSPGSADLQAHLGESYRKAGRYEEALPSLEAAIGLKPMHAGARNNIGAALVALHRTDEAMPHLNAAASMMPNDPEAQINIGISFLNQNRPEKALPYFERALATSPDVLEVIQHLTVTLEQLDRFEDAEAHYRRADKIGVADNSLRAYMAQNLDRQGQQEEARALLRGLIDEDPSDPKVALVRAGFASNPENHEAAGRGLELALERGDSSPEIRRSLKFALGRIKDRLGDYDAAFTSYRDANATLPFPYNHEVELAEQAETERVFAEGWQARLARATNQSDLPVFVVGMPRSGTTLVEQILACHSQVHGAGERGEIQVIIDDISNEARAGDVYPGCLSTIDSAQLDRHAEAYLATMRQLGGTALRVIDKMPHNHRHLGLIQQLYPKARVIHCQRDPLDTCLSCFFQDFRSGHGYAHDLMALGAHYRLYERAMSHWNTVSGLEILDVSYEAVVADLESMARKMVSFLGLEWDPACLEFHRSSRRALTASYNQVRQPIYSRSVSRADRYAEHLKPLIAALRGEEGAVTA
jgi:tetratricopeptide (TPR) repeat protein